jgi:SAM-dependent methyltransferase
VGGRKSHYTIGLNADVTVTDLPRETNLQRQLNLGINARMIEQMRKRRSNVKGIVYDDMTCSKLPSGGYDIIVAVEVLEHVEQDELFLKNVARVLRPGGVFFMTTPNGDYIRNTNPDHKRHYQRHLLVELLAKHFSAVEVWYAVPAGTFHRVGVRGSWSWRRPFRTTGRMACGLMHNLQTRMLDVRTQGYGTAHLFGSAHSPQ